MRKNRDRRAAFTLMEVLLVLVILVILGGIVGVSISQTRKKGLTGTAKVQLSALKGPLENYSTDNGRYPSSQQGLSALRQAPSDLANPQKWQGPYTEAEVGLDPWGNPYQYESDGSSYRVWSWGPNGVNDQGGNDDILIEGQ